MRSFEHSRSESAPAKYEENDQKIPIHLITVFDPLKINLDSARQNQKEKEADMLKKQIEETRKIKRQL